MNEKSLEQIRKEIEPNKFYRPRQISENGWMFGYQGKNPYFCILELIKQNKLRAKDFGRGRIAYYRLLGSEIIRYLDTLK